MAMVEPEEPGATRPFREHMKMDQRSIPIPDRRQAHPRSQSESDVLDHIRHTLVSIRREMTLGTRVDGPMIDKLESDFARAERASIEHTPPWPPKKSKII